MLWENRNPVALSEDSRCVHVRDGVHVRGHDRRAVEFVTRVFKRVLDIKVDFLARCNRRLLGYDQHVAEVQLSLRHEHDLATAHR